MTASIHRLHPHGEPYTPEQVFKAAAEDVDGYERVVIITQNKDGSMDVMSTHPYTGDIYLLMAIAQQALIEYSGG